MLMGHYLTYGYSYSLEIFTVRYFHVKIFGGKIFLPYWVTNGIFVATNYFKIKILLLLVTLLPYTQCFRLHLVMYSCLTYI